MTEWYSVELQIERFWARTLYLPDEDEQIKMNQISGNTHKTLANVPR